MGKPGFSATWRNETAEAAKGTGQELHSAKKVKIFTCIFAVLVIEYQHALESIPRSPLPFLPFGGGSGIKVSVTVHARFFYSAFFRFRNRYDFAGRTSGR